MRTVVTEHGPEVGQAVVYKQTGHVGRIVWVKQDPFNRTLEVAVQLGNGAHFAGQWSEFRPATEAEESQL